MVMVVCQICQKECKNKGSFANHLKFHYSETTPEKYYFKYILPKSKCIICDSSDTKFLGVTRGYSSTCGNKNCVKKSYASGDKILYAKRNNITEKEAKVILHKKFMSSFKGSPFNYEFWMKKGFSEKEAKHKSNSIRPIKKEYWLERGYSKKESIKKAEEIKNSNNKKGAKKSSEILFEERIKKSPRRIEYWLERGCSEIEAKEQVSERQRTFTLEKCIEKLGEKLGKERWLERQEKWQKSYKKSNFSKISQKLFWQVYNIMIIKENVIFATLKEGKLDDSGNNNELRLKLDSKVIMPDFILNNKIIEFDGDYWHGEKRGNKKRENERDKLIRNNGYQILHIKERDYKENPQQIINECLDFLND